ncbi:MAG: efflux RND transporter periplasmic adaptor subunit, partial [Acidobacteria bacterium]|nr:efflux RND transporter periplasmic adaptor subunit [Acidobacteriota bacterium]
EAPSAPPPAQSTAAPAPQKDSATVTMDPAVQKSAGIVVEEAPLRSLPQVIRATARLSNDENQTWRVGAITDGRIVRVLANPGDTVAPGAVLARMHSHDIHESRAAYQKAQMELARTRSEEAFAQRARDRAKRLYDLKAGSQEQYERAETELKNSQTMVANAQVELDRTRNHLTEFLGVPADNPPHPGPLPHDREDETEFIPVTTPAGGTVISRAVTPGTVVTPANDLFIVSNLSSLWAIAEVNEEYLPRLRPGMPARIYVQAYGRESFSGRIGRLGEAFDPTTRTVKVRIDLPNRGGRLKPEMYASAEIEVGGSEPAVFVPQGAIQEVRGENVVFVRTAADRFEVRALELGRTLDGSFEVLRGLKPGERVATRGAFVLKSEYLKAALAGE